MLLQDSTELTPTQRRIPGAAIFFSPRAFLAQARDGSNATARGEQSIRKSTIYTPPPGRYNGQVQRRHAGNERSALRRLQRPLWLEHPFRAVFQPFL